MAVFSWEIWIERREMKIPSVPKGIEEEWPLFSKMKTAFVWTNNSKIVPHKLMWSSIIFQGKTVNQERISTQGSDLHSPEWLIHCDIEDRSKLFFCGEISIDWREVLLTQVNWWKVIFRDGKLTDLFCALSMWKRRICGREEKCSESLWTVGFFSSF